jgi:hypothetical protein
MGSGFFRKLFLIGVTAMAAMQIDANARPYYYPQIRYMSPYSESMGSVVLPVQDEVGNVLMNNPAALARYKGYRAEPLNLGLSVNSNHLMDGILSSPTGAYTLGGISSILNGSPDTPFGLGYSNMSAFSYGNWAAGILIQEHSRAISDGTNVTYQAINQIVPTIGFGFGMARNVMRFGYSLQYVNQTSGTATGVSDSSASFMSGLARGSGLSHNVSFNFALPFTFLPSFTVVARNLGGLTFSGSRLIPRGTNFQGSLEEEPMTIDASFDALFKVTGNFHIRMMLEYRAMNNSVAFPNALDKFNLGMDIPLSRHFAIRAGAMGLTNFSYGIGYKGDYGELNLAGYSERTPFSTGETYESRYALQFKIRLYEQAKKSEDPLSEVGSKR